MSEQRYKEAERELDGDTFRRMVELKRIGSRAVQQVQEENRKRGIPNVYSIRGHIYYERPDGTLTLEDPYPESHVDDGDPEP
jgi:hypothetical protein